MLHEYEINTTPNLSFVETAILPMISYSTEKSLSHLHESDIFEVPVGLLIILSLFYGSISVLAVIGNSLVIWIVATTRQMQSVTNLFIANLALADVIIGMFAIPFQFHAAVLQRWNLPDFMCAFCPYVQLVSVNVSVFTLTAIAVDRHRAIINPLRQMMSSGILGAVSAGCAYMFGNNGTIHNTLVDASMHHIQSLEIYVKD